jgi:hypothetical protein
VYGYIEPRQEDYFPEFSQGLIAYDKYQGQSEEIIKSRAFHYNQKVRSDLKKWLWGEDVRRYSVNWNEKEWIDYCSGVANPRQPKFFKDERILIREITNPSVFCGFTNEELYHDPAVIVILKSSKFSLKVLLGILNSKLATFYHFNSSPKATKGAFPKILVEDIKNFPIPEATEAEKAEIEGKVEQILDAKRENPQADTSKLECKIDCLVYKLYDLSEDEIRIVKGEA